MFYALFAVSFLGTLLVGLKSGARRAVAIGWVGTAFLMPFWLQSSMGSLLLDLRSAAVLAVAICYILRRPSEPFQFTLADFLIAGIVLAQAVSQYQVGALRPLTVPEIFRKWVGPYVMGRMVLGSVGDLKQAVAGFARVIAVLIPLAAAECALQFNIINTFLGRTFNLLEAGEGYRWGLKRAHVTFDHPIFFGMALVLLLPWALEAGRLARTGEGPRWWRFLPWAMAVGLFSTVSRGPQMAGLATYGIYLFFRIPKIRIPAIVLAVIGGGAVYGFKEELVDVLAIVAGEKTAGGESKFILIDGEEYEYTGTNHRVLLFKAYDLPAQNAGVFGYGTELLGVELEESIAERFASIDCHYLLFLLQHGWLGIGAFLILTVGNVISLAFVAFRRSLPHAGLAASLIGAIISVAVLLMSVWFSPDFGGIWLFAAGLAARLRSLSTIAGDNVTALASHPAIDSTIATKAPVGIEHTTDRPLATGTPVRPRTLLDEIARSTSNDPALSPSGTPVRPETP